MKSVFRLRLMCDVCRVTIGDSSRFERDEIPVGEIRMAIRKHVVESKEHQRRLVRKSGMGGE